METGLPVPKSVSLLVVISIIASRASTICMKVGERERDRERKRERERERGREKVKETLKKKRKRIKRDTPKHMENEKDAQKSY